MPSQIRSETCLASKRLDMKNCAGSAIKIQGILMKNSDTYMERMSWPETEEQQRPK